MSKAKKQFTPPPSAPTEEALEREAEELYPYWVEHIRLACYTQQDIADAQRKAHIAARSQAVTVGIKDFLSKQKLPTKEEMEILDKTFKRLKSDTPTSLDAGNKTDKK